MRRDAWLIKTASSNPLTLPSPPDGEKGLRTHGSRRREDRWSGRHPFRWSGVCRGLVAGFVLILCSPTWAGPNLLAIGNFGEVPFKRAEGRDSFSGKEIIYSFDDPEFDFGRVIVRSNQPKVLVRRDLFVGFTGNDLTVNLQAQPQGGRSSGGSVQLQEL